MPQSCSRAETDGHNMWPAAVATLLLPLLLLAIRPNLAFTAKELVEQSYREQRFETLLLMRHSRQPQCSQMEQLTADSEWPVLRLNSEAKFFLRARQNTEMFSVICVSGQLQLDEELWQALANSLYNMRHIRLLLLLEQETDRKPQPQVFREIAATARQLKFPHVVLLLPSGHAHQLQPYTDPAWQQVPLKRSPIFVRQHNYHGRIAFSLPDEVIPNAAALKNMRTGEVHLTGFMAMTIRQFTNFHNITLRSLPLLNITEPLSIMLVRNLTLDQVLDLPMTLCGFETSMQGMYTYPYEVGRWSLVVPCAQEISTASVYLRLISRNMLYVLIASYCIFALLDTCFGWLLMNRRFDWTNLVFNERMISGIIGQPCRLQSEASSSSRLTLSQLFFVGLVSSSLIAAHLKTLLTKRPMGRMVTTYEELRDSDLQINFAADEEYYVNFMNENSPIQIIKSRIIYLEIRQLMQMHKKPTKTNAFSMTNTFWEIYKQQQGLFKRPVLCLHPNLIFRNLLLFSMPLQPNSIYSPPLEQFLLRVKDSGLLQYWMDDTMRDILSLGYFPRSDPFPYETFHDFKVGDLFYVWMGLFCALSLALATFLSELFLHHKLKKKSKFTFEKCLKEMF